MNQTESVKEFYNQHASVYKKKYSEENDFYLYFFVERLEKATRLIDLSECRILDIGAGTGALYDFLRERRITFGQYKALDISKEMLSQSNIPEKDRYVGDFLRMSFNHQFDTVFMLGVSTYIDKDLLQEYLLKLNKILSTNGKLIITFTNRNSLDSWMRKLFTPLMRLLKPEGRVISQDFNINEYTSVEITRLIGSNFSIDTIEGLNHTFFPINRLFSSESVRLANRINKLRFRNIKKILSSDLLVIMTKNKG